MAGKKLVLFDFDGTITTVDTMFLFTRFVVGTPRFLFGLAVLSVPLILHKLRVVSAQKAKEIMLTHFFKGMSKDEFDQYGKNFSKTIPGYVRPAAHEAIRNHRSANSRIIVVSASAENWMSHWCTDNNLEYLATRLEVIDQKITGKILGKNCNSDEKVNRIKEKINLSDYTDIIVYGDTSGDLPMLALGTEKHFKPFRDSK
jgi:phosphatidylglycerophosphatase C